MDDPVPRGLSWLVETRHALDQQLGDPEGSLHGLVELGLTLIRQAQPPGSVPGGGARAGPAVGALRSHSQAGPGDSAAAPPPFPGPPVPGAPRRPLPRRRGTDPRHHPRRQGPAVAHRPHPRRQRPDHPRDGPAPTATPGRRRDCSTSAITRATEQLCLYSPADIGGGDEDQPSRFLDPVRDQLDHQRIAARGPRQEAG